jgi:predicted dehydrogenase
MKVAIIGAGLQMRRRAQAIKESADDEVVEVVGQKSESSVPIAEQYGCDWSTDWRHAVERKDVDAVLVCTPPHIHAEVTIAALENGKHVLCEKPLCRSMSEADAMVKTAERTGLTLKCGFNHRHHPAILEAHTRFERGEIGRIISARCRYGICGRPSHEHEWRSDPKRAAGGQFMEQGTHGIDLFRWFMGELVEVSCMTTIGFFHGQTLDDNGMAVFRSAEGGLATLHSSLTQWKNLFSLDLMGTDGYLLIEGLGGAYGNERLYAGKRDYDAPFQDLVVEYRGSDTSWRSEWREFKAAIAEGRPPIGDGRDGREAMRLALAAYHAERTKSVVSVPGFGKGS